MSEVLVPKYYNTKINNHDWHIYMGGERYFPAYPAKWVVPTPPPEPPEPEPEDNAVKRYLIKDSSKHNSYEEYYRNRYPLTTKEAYINENNETMEFNGKTYYVWRGWNQSNEDSFPDSDMRYGDSQLILLTTKRNPTLPLTNESQEFGYILTIDSNIDETEYLSSKYTFVAQINEDENQEQSVRMANIGVRMYNYRITEDLILNEGYDDSVVDYFQYDGEMLDYMGQTCFVWNRYDSNVFCTKEGIQYENCTIKLQKILTSTHWISELPFTMESPEFVALINYEDIYIDKPKIMPFDRIEYLPGSTTYIPREITDEAIDINVKTYLTDDEVEPFSNPINIHYVYDGQTMEWNGKTCYIWRKDDLYGYGDCVYYPYIVLTNTLDITVPLSHDADYFEAAFDYEDNVANYNGMGDNTIGGAGKRAIHIIRDYSIHYDPPFYIKK